MLDACNGRCAFCAVAGACAGGGVKNEDVIHCNRGGPYTVSKGIASSELSPKACTVKDASVVHRRRADWSQVLSSALNIVSSGTGPLPIQTPAGSDLIQR